MRPTDREKGEAVVAAHLRDLYHLRGEVETVVAGANWTMRLSAATGQAIAYVRLCRHDRSLEDIHAEMAVLNAIQATPALDAGRPIASRLGSNVSTLTLPDGSTRFATVFQPVGGNEPADRPSDYALIGVALADLHRQPVLSTLAPSRSPGLSTAIGSIEKIALHSKATADHLADAIASLKREGADGALGTVGFCHGDVRPQNMRILGNQVTLFDFDDCGRGPQVIDIAAIALWLEASMQAEPDQMWRAFLDGYGVRMTEQLAKSIRWCVLQQQIRMTRWLIEECEFVDELWSVVWERARIIANNAVSGNLRVLRSPTG